MADLNITAYFAAHGGNNSGTADCTEAVQACVNDAISDDKVVYVPPGVYLLTIQTGENSTDEVNYFWHTQDYERRKDNSVKIFQCFGAIWIRPNAGTGLKRFRMRGDPGATFICQPPGRKPTAANPLYSIFITDNSLEEAEAAPNLVDCSIKGINFRFDEFIVNWPPPNDPGGTPVPTDPLKGLRALQLVGIQGLTIEDCAFFDPTFVLDKSRPQEPNIRGGGGFIRNCDTFRISKCSFTCRGGLNLKYVKHGIVEDLTMTAVGEGLDFDECVSSTQINRITAYGLQVESAKPRQASERLQFIGVGAVDQFVQVKLGGTTETFTLGDGITIGSTKESTAGHFANYVQTHSNLVNASVSGDVVTLVARNNYEGAAGNAIEVTASGGSAMVLSSKCLSFDGPGAADQTVTLTKSPTTEVFTLGAGAGQIHVGVTAEQTATNFAQFVNYHSALVRATVSADIVRLIARVSGSIIGTTSMDADMEFTPTTLFGGGVQFEPPQLLDLAGAVDVAVEDITAEHFGTAFSLYSKADGWPTYAEWYNHPYVADRSDPNINYEYNGPAPYSSRVYSKNVSISNVFHTGFGANSMRTHRCVELGRDFVVSQSAAVQEYDYKEALPPDNIRVSRFTSVEGAYFAVGEVTNCVLENITLLRPFVSVEEDNPRGAFSLKSSYRDLVDDNLDHPKGNCTGVIKDVYVTGPNSAEPPAFGVQDLEGIRIEVPRNPQTQQDAWVTVEGIAVANCITGVHVVGESNGVAIVMDQVDGNDQDIVLDSGAVAGTLIKWRDPGQPLEITSSIPSSWNRTLEPQEVGRPISVRLGTGTLQLVLPSPGVPGRIVGPVTRVSGPASINIRYPASGSGSIKGSITDLDPVPKTAKDNGVAWTVE